MVQIVLASGRPAPKYETGTLKGRRQDALRAGALRKDRCAGNLLGLCIEHDISCPCSTLGNIWVMMYLNLHGINAIIYGGQEMFSNI